MKLTYTSMQCLNMTFSYKSSQKYRDYTQELT